MLNAGLIVGLCLSISAAVEQPVDHVALGKLESGATVSFVQGDEGQWGIEVTGGLLPRIVQMLPVQIETFRSDSDIDELRSAYTRVERSADGVEAYVRVFSGSDNVFNVSDQWRIDGNVLSVNRKVEVTGSGTGGFYSAVVLTIDSATDWSDVQYFAPSALYGDPTYDGDYSAGGTRNNEARCFTMREDILAAPVFAVSFNDGGSVTVLDPSPRGDTTVEESRMASQVMTDARYQFGSLGAWQTEGNPIEFGFRFPGTIRRLGRGGFGGPQWLRRYHPIEEGVDHHYQVSFRFGEETSFPSVTRNAWRWAWDALDPKVTPIDIDQMRRVLIDNLVDQAATIDGRTAIPFVVNTITDVKQWNYTMVAMGFVGKNIECANQLLLEGDRDSTERGKRMRETGLAVISSLIEALPTVPLQGTGYDLATGGPWTGDHQEWVAPWLRNATEDMAVLMQAYRRERENGVLHPEWFNWMKTYVDWLIDQQREGGSFPRRWKPGSSEVEEPTGTTSYCPVPLLVMMSEETGDPKYMESAKQAAQYIWDNWGSRGLFIGGASDNPNITDKEAGMLSLEAFLILYESTKDDKWLEYAKTAGDFTESWMWIWNIPMPVDADDADLHWKKGVPTLGVQGITALHNGGVDEYLSWSVPAYAKLYKYTGDEHYLDVARVLLHATKSMVAIPGRLYDYKGIGWQQENWMLGPGGSGRGVGGHRFWLPWITANHLNGITGLELFDKDLFAQLTEVE